MSLPITKGLLYGFKVRFYVDGVKEMWKEENSAPRVILARGDTISSFVRKTVHKFSKGQYKKIVPYEFFFTNMCSAIGVATALKYELSGKNNAVTFYENGAVSFRGFTVQKNIYFNPGEGYFETDFNIVSGGIKSNPDNITNLNSLFDSTEVLLMFRFIGDKKLELPVSRSKSRVVNINRIVLSDFFELRYGNGFQYISNPAGKFSIINNNEIDKLNPFFGKIREEEMWRYCFVSLPLKKE